MQTYDRFQSESYEDYLRRGRSEREATELREMLAERYTQSDADVSQDDRDELARLQMRDAERESVNGGDE